MGFNYYHSYNPIDSFFTSAVTGVMTMIALTALIFTLIFVIINVIGKIKLFQKCGKEGWKAIIPFYSSYVFMVEICGLHWAWFVASIATDIFSFANAIAKVLGVFVNAIAFYNIATRCNKDKIATMIFGGLFPNITTMVYGFSKLDYDSSIPVSESGVF